MFLWRLVIILETASGMYAEFHDEVGNPVDNCVSCFELEAGHLSTV
jgi:hypothetical protein